MIKNCFKIEKCRIIFYDDEKDCLFFYEEELRVDSDKKNGIGGDVFLSGEPLSISSCY